MNKLLIAISWLGATSVTLVISLVVLVNLSENYSLKKKALVLGVTQVKSELMQLETDQGFGQQSVQMAVKSKDARPLIVREFIKGSPLEGLSLENFVIQKADSMAARNPKINSTDLVFLTFAIAQQESTMCRKIPFNSHNCHGWGMSEKNLEEGNYPRFDNYFDSFDAVMNWLVEKYLSKGISDPREVKNLYNFYSTSWDESVLFFYQKLHNGEV
jgi:hypothetical protein